MKEIAIKKYVRYLFLISVLVFVINKFYLRPWVLENEQSEVSRIIVLSLPNLIEAIVGSLILTGILFQLKVRFYGNENHIKDTNIYLMATGIAAIYVLSQEFGFHNIGGNNVYDIYDVIASIFGLTLTFGFIQVHGFIQMQKTEI